MSTLLVSVRSPEEAQTAVRGGAGIIDVKEPSEGPLGMAPAHTIHKILNTIKESKVVSAALGDLKDWDNSSTDLRFSGLDFVKVGLGGERKTDWRVRLERLRRTLATDKASFILVVYADNSQANSPPAEEVLNWAAEMQYRGVLIDTWRKDGKWLRNWLSLKELSRLRSLAGEHNLLFALAGSLSVERIRLLKEISPDIFGVRGAACGKGLREGKIELEAVKHLAAEVQLSIPNSLAPTFFLGNSAR